MSPGSKNKILLDEPGRLTSRKPYLLLRARMVQAIRLFFIERDYLEVETPQLIPAPTPEVNIDPIPAGDRYLHSSPELCMKRLLAANYSRIFQISKCFRAGERGHLHLPELTLLEWYRAGIDYTLLMKECEALILWVSQSLDLGEKICFQENEIDLRSPWERISVSDAFHRHTSLTPELALNRGCFDEVMVNKIEPHLGINTPTFLYDYPAPLAALARLRPDHQGLAERFEIYVGGVELANGFSELTDEQEQRARFEREQQQRRNLGKQVYPMAERFLKSLGHLPEAAGIALGVDRLAMIFADRPQVDDVVAFTPEEV